MQEIAKKVYELLHVKYPNYSKETLCNNALLELNDNLNLTAEDIVDIIAPKLEAYQVRKNKKIAKFLKKQKV